MGSGFIFDHYLLMAARFVVVVTKPKLPPHGQPFGLMCQGFLSHGSFTWTYKFLRALDAAIVSHTTAHPSVPLPSSLLLAMGVDGKLLLPLQPMS